MKHLQVSVTLDPKREFLIPLQIQFASSSSNVSNAFVATYTLVLIIRSRFSMLYLRTLKINFNSEGY